MADLFDLVAKLTLDSSEYESGLKSAQSKASAIGGITKSILGAAVIKDAAAGIASFGKASLDAGMNFDSSMSQVAATMGTTVDEIGNLRDFAQEMGSATAFSATEAADALNYMALAGYDAETSMTMLPNVLNLAAAGGIDLAAASDMVTDASSALGLSLDQTSTLVDQMAKASSMSNTSVAQLGDAILTVGGTAKNLAGGTTELSTALGILADNGIKGAEGGTALRNIILSLSAPTDTAAKKMEELGLSVYDAEGKMRPMEDIFNDLNSSLSSMSQGEQTEVLSTLFNKVDLKSANALLATSSDRWKQLAEGIDNASGAAQNMADTQLDNLSGDITLFKSALEGAQIAVSDVLSPALRDFVQLGTSGITDVTQAFQSGGLTAAAGAAGEVIGDLVNKIAAYAPQVVQAAVTLVTSLGSALIQNAPQLLSAAIQIVQVLINGLAEVAPSIGPAAVGLVTQIATMLTDPGTLNSLLTGAIAIVQGLADGLIQAVPQLISAIPTIISNLVNFLVQGAPQLIVAGVQLMIQLAVGLIQAIPSILEALPQIVDSVAQGLISLAPNLLKAGAEMAKSAWEGIKSIFKGGDKADASESVDFSGLESKTQQAASSMSSISSAASQTASSVTSSFSSISTAADFTALGTNATTAFSGISTSAQTAASSVTESFSSVGTGVSENINAGLQSVEWSTMSSGASETVQSVKSSFAELPPQLKADFEMIKQAVRELHRFVKQQFDQMAKEAVNAWQNVPTQINTYFNQINTNATTLATNIRTTFNQLATDATTWGQDMMTNFGGGITTGSQPVFQAVETAAAQIKRILGFSEPEEGPLSNFHTYAPDMMKLFAQGVKENTDMVQRQVEKSFDFRKIMPTEMTYSTASTGARGATATDRKLDQLTAIVRQYLPQLANAKVVMDSGVTVGALVPEIDKQLGQRFRVRERAGA